jgi:hypothetical protein
MLNWQGCGLVPHTSRFSPSIRLDGVCTAMSIFVLNRRCSARGLNPESPTYNFEYAEVAFSVNI